MDQFIKKISNILSLQKCKTKSGILKIVPRWRSFLNRKHGYLVSVIVTAQETVLVEEGDNVKAMKQEAGAKESAKI